MQGSLILQLRGIEPSFLIFVFVLKNRHGLAKPGRFLFLQNFRMFSETLKERGRGLLIQTSPPPEREFFIFDRQKRSKLWVERRMVLSPPVVCPRLLLPIQGSEVSHNLHMFGASHGGPFP